MLDVERAPWRFRYRLIGGALPAAGAPARTGDYIDQYETTGTTTARFVRVCVEREPHFRRGPPRLRHTAGVRELESLVMPLASDGRTVDILLCCTVYHWQSGFGPTSPLSA